ncbi:MAG: alpha-2-macroglobulin [Sideroxyarcus sp.]|nr:alpha-2-macroglobulin [Sideroxyarcus sp.]
MRSWLALILNGMLKLSILLRLPFRLVGMLFGGVFGHLHWQRPAWVGLSFHGAAVAFNWGKSNPRKFAKYGGIAIAALGVVWGAWYAYSLIPKPELVSYDVYAPSRTEYELESYEPKPLIVRFSGSVAPLDKVGKEVTGVRISPEQPGRWSWLSDTTLEFKPNADWPVGQEFKVGFERELLAQTVRVEDYSFKFETAAFEMSINSSEFYQDPVDPNLKKAIVTVGFSHPVATEGFEKRISMRLQGQRSGVLGIGGETTPFSVTYDKKKLTAFIHSAPLPIPPKDTYLAVKVDSGVSAQSGGNDTDDALEQTISVPGLFSLNVDSAEMLLVNNERYEPEQVLMLETSATVDETDMKNRVEAWLLPVYNPETPLDQRKNPTYWGDVKQIGEPLLKQSGKLALTAIPAEREYSTSHSYKFEADVGRFIYVRVAKGLKSFGGYSLGETYDRIIRVQPFPKEVRILHSGSLLPISGERKVPILARDVDALHYEIGRLVPGQIQHLVSQSYGDFGKPNFNNYNFNFDNLAERLTEIDELPKLAPGKAQYAALDLGKYLKEGSEGKRGLFMIKVQPYDTVAKRPIGNADTRLIVLTDLGMLVKQGVDGSQDVFVQSIHTGSPVGGASVQVIGKNGLPVLSQETDAEGHVRFPSLKDFNREQSPALYLVKKGGDISFLPYERSDRMLDISRFDVGGVSNSAQSDKLQAYLFSDRGIYQPGEELKVGMIVRATDWSSKLAGIPLEMVITDARGLTVKRERIKLPESGFVEASYATEDTSPTGTWNANLYIVKDNHATGMIGTVALKVQEFRPDRMKMSARFSDEAVEGWVSPDNLKARVNLQNLFGTPATDREVRASITLFPSYPSFPSYKEYSFFDPQRARDGFEDRLAEGVTDENGEAEFDLNLQRFARATYRVLFVAQGFEAAGGRSVAAERAVMVSSMPYLVGYKADGNLRYVNKDARRSVHLIAIDPKAKKTKIPGLKLIRIERKYVSVLTRQDSGVYKYESKSKEVVLSETPFQIGAEGTNLELPTGEPGDYVMVVRDAEGMELNRVEYSVAGHANLTRSLEKNAELQIKLAKTDVIPGQDIELEIRAPYAGNGLITIERDKVYAWQWFKAGTTNSVQRIRVPASMEGNGYVSVTFVRDINSPEIFMSPMSHGVVPFSISLERRRNDISMTAPDLVKPGEPLRMKVSAEKPTRLVLFAVDEGILQVAGYNTPDPLGHFFQKRALEISTSQILDLILPEFRRLMQSSPTGGDAEGALGKHLNPFKRKRDKPVAYWSGIIDVGPNGKDLVYTVPDHFNGSLRIMAVAVSADTIGVLEKKVTVRGDFVLSPNVPTQVAPGDEFEVSLGVANNIPASGKDAPVRIELKTSPHLAVVGDAAKELKIDALREGVAIFRLRATDKLGSGNLQFVATHGNHSAKYSVDTSVRPAVPYQVNLTFGSVKKGTLEQPVTRKMYDEFSTRKAGISHLPLIMGQGLVAYLDKNPYGCTEQLVSQALPALVLQTRPEFGVTRNVSEESLGRIVSMLRSRQNQEGGFGLWAANHHVVPWASAYAVHFLLEAKDRGHAVPPDMLLSANGWLQQLAGGESESLAEERARAYAIYLLARQGTVVGQYASALQRRLDANFAKVWRQDIAAAYLASAYQLMRQENLADGLIRGFRFDQDAGKWADYYDGLSRNSQFIYLLARHFPNELKRLDAEALESVAKPIRENRYNTLSSAYTLLALDAYATATGSETAGQFSIAEVLKDGSKKTLALPAGLMPVGDFSPAATKLQFGSSSDYVAFTLLNQSGFDRGLPDKEIKQEIEVFREYQGADGKPVSTVKLGDEVEVHLRIRAIGKGTLHDVAIVDLLPGGFEIVPGSGNDAEPESGSDNSAYQSEGEEEEYAEGDGEGDGETASSETQAEQWVAPIGSDKSDWQPEYADVREDRVVLYGTVENSAQLFVYKIKATNAGIYAVPPTYAEGMYDRSVQARALGGKITVQAE